MSYEEMIAVLEAASTGAKIQVRLHSDDKWKPTDKLMWDFAEFDYRVQPTPRDFYLTIATGHNNFLVFETKSDALRAGWKESEIIRVREIL